MTGGEAKRRLGLAESVLALLDVRGVTSFDGETLEYAVEIDCEDEAELLARWHAWIAATT